jgi:hypothetical protein
MSRYLRGSNPYWDLINPWRDIRLVGKMCFDTFRDNTERDMALWALVILVSVCTVSLIALARRVRAVEIVT